MRVGLRFGVVAACVSIVAGAGPRLDAQTVSEDASSRENRVDGSIPEELLGDFIDDYGIRYTVDGRFWKQDSGARLEIRAWNVASRFLITRNENDDPTAPAVWTRIDWVLLPAGTDAETHYAWAFCYAVYDASSEAAARSGAPSDRDHPRTGCNGFPFSRMSREGAPGAR